MLSEFRSRTGASFVVLAIIVLTVVMVTAVTYLVYVFIDATHVSNAAGVHVTKSLLLAAKDAQGKLYSNPEKNISNWTVYTDKNLGFEIKYPGDMQFQRQPESGEHTLVLKKFSTNQPAGMDSLEMEVFFDSETVSDNFLLRDEIKEKGFVWNGEWQQQEIGGKSGIRTGQLKENSGVVKDMILWQFGGKIYILGADYFKTNTEDPELFQKIISEFRFL